MTYLIPHGERVEAWGPEEEPRGFIWRNTTHSVLEVTNRWRVHTLWWEPENTIWREYLKVVTDQGLLCIIFRDLLRGGWFMNRIYDWTV